MACIYMTNIDTAFATEHYNIKTLSNNYKKSTFELLLEI